MPVIDVADPPQVTLREVVESDLETFYEQQLDPDAARMAAFPSRDHDGFMSHWRTKVLADPSAAVRTVLADGRIAGWVAAFDQGGRRLVGYWIGRSFWGRGIATAALSAFVDVERTRPLYAFVATHNVGSIRVLEKSGFTWSSEDPGPPAFDDGVEELLYELRS
jgi:RimJ/RimL family protein N-acetyltransferase